MNDRVVVLGLDPGFASLGWAMIALTETAEAVLGMGVLRTEKATTRRGILAADDDTRRARELAKGLRKLVRYAGGVKVMCAESMSYPRNAASAAKLAMSLGIVACLAEEHDVPIIQASPQEVKRKLCKDRGAAKEEVKRALVRRFGFSEGELPTSEMLGKPMLSDVPKGKHEHAWDALAMAVMALDSEAIRLARKMIAAEE